MISTVRPASSRASASRISASLLASRLAVASSRMRTGASFRNAAGDGQALPLPAAQPGALLAQRRVVAAGQRLDELVGVSSPRRGDHGIHAGLRPREADVVGDGAVEEVRQLRHPGDLPAPHRPIDAVQRQAAHGDPAGIRVDEAQQQARHRRLARAGRPDQRHGLAVRDRQREALQRRAPLPLAIARPSAAGAGYANFTSSKRMSKRSSAGACRSAGPLTR